MMAAARERRELVSALTEPAFYLCKTIIEPVVRNDTGKPCPLTGSEQIRSLGRQDDLTFAIDLESGTRINGWSIMNPGRREAFDELVDEAEPDGETVRLVEIVWQCPEDHVQALQDDSTEVIYWSGGWRAGKTVRRDQWWARGWCKYGAYGERFWLVGPRQLHAFNLMTKIFLGREGCPPVLPTQDHQPILAGRLPRKVSERTLNFSMRDGSIIELHHAEGNIANMEGEAVRRIALEEASRIRKADAYDVCRGRVMQCMGQIGISSVPDDDGEWLYDKVVKEFERGAENRLVITLSGKDNPWLSEAAFQRMYDGEPDPVVRAQKVMGQWDRGGLYAYVDVFDEKQAVIDELEPDAVAELLGKKDITQDVARWACGVKRSRDIGDWLMMADFNWDPQTQLAARVYGELKDWRTWTTVFFREFIGRWKDSGEAAADLSKLEGGRFANSIVICDGNGFHNPHLYPGSKSATFDAVEFRKAGFHPFGPIVTFPKDGSTPRRSNPGIPESRRINRYLMREGQLLFCERGVPRTLNAVRRAPNRRKLNREAGTRIDREIYNVEDCMRYGTWRVYSKHIDSVRQKAHDDAKAAAS